MSMFTQSRDLVSTVTWKRRMSLGFPAFFKQFWLHFRKNFKKNLKKHRIAKYIMPGFV